MVVIVAIGIARGRVVGRLARLHVLFGEFLVKAAMTAAVGSAGQSQRREGKRDRQKGEDLHFEFERVTGVCSARIICTEI